MQAAQGWVDGAPLELTALEHRLLATFFERAGPARSREALLQLAWADEGGDVSLRAVDARIKAVRLRLGPAAALLETVRGVGYRFGARG